MHSKKNSLFMELLLEKLNVEFEPENVPVKVMLSGRKNNCYNNVAEKIKQDGGSIHYGWAIWPAEHILEAEHHAVWEDGEGNLIDISPRDIELTYIIFVSDNTRVYTGQSIDNVRINITSNPVVDDYIFICETIESLFIRYGNRKNDEEINLPQIAAQYIDQYGKKKADIFNFINSGGKYGSPCYCGSLQKFSKCHGSNLREGASKAFKHIDTILSKE